MTATEREVALLLGQIPRRVALRASPYMTSFELNEVEVTLEDGTQLNLMLKDCGPDALSVEARLAKPVFLQEPKREILTYLRLLGSEGKWAPRVYGSMLDPSGGRYWLLMERLRGVELFQVGELETWRSVARWLARLHLDRGVAARCADVPLVQYDRHLYRFWGARALEFGRPGPRLRQLLDGWEEIVDELLELPRTFIHGEFYASNILVDQRGRELRIAGVDWELAGRGPGVVDLAALTSGGWTAEQQAAIVSAYEDEWRAANDDTRWFGRGLSLARLHLAVQWLGWSRGWQPPRHLSHDWRTEGERHALALRR